MKDFKVYSTGFFGMAASGMGWFVQNVEPVLKAALLVVQVGIAVATFIYLLRRLREKKLQDKNDDEII